MAQIGTDDNRFKLYIVIDADDPPVSDADFVDYTFQAVDWKVTIGINKLSLFEGRFKAITSSDNTYFKAGNLLYVLSKRVLVGKFVIEEPEYESSDTITVKGIQSTGTSKRYEGFMRKLAKESTGKIIYAPRTVNQILDSGSLSPINQVGLVRDQESADEILELGTDDGGTTVISTAFNTTNKIDAIAKTAMFSNQDWYISHGTNSVTPFSTGDELHVLASRGDPGNTFEFFIDSDGANQNVISARCNRDNQHLMNDIVIEGNDIYGNKITTEIYEATGVEAETTVTLDGFVATDVFPGDTSIYLKENTYWESVLSLNVPIKIKIDNEFINVTAIAAFGDLTTLTVVRGLNDTKDTYHRKGSEALVINDTGTTLVAGTTMTITVDDASSFSASGKIKIGNEIITYTGIIGGTDFVCTRYATSTDLYAHGSGIKVYQYYDGVNTFTPASPEGSGSPNSINAYGIHKVIINEPNIINKDTMDRYAQVLLAAGREPIYRIMIEAGDPFDVLDNIEIGDEILIDDATSINYPAGGLYADVGVRVMGMEVGESNFIPFCIVHLGEENKLLRSFSFDSFAENMREDSKKQTNENLVRSDPFSDPQLDSGYFDQGTKGSYGNVLNSHAETGTAGRYQLSFSGTNTSVSLNWQKESASVTHLEGDVYRKTDNKLYYYDGSAEYDLAATGSSSKWEDGTTANTIRPIDINHSIVPKSTNEEASVSDVGEATNEWRNVYAYAGIFSVSVDAPDVTANDVTADDMLLNAAGTLTVPSDGFIILNYSAGNGGDISFNTSANAYTLNAASDEMTLTRTGSGILKLGSPTDNVSLTINGNVVLGNADTNSITVNGEFVSDLFPDVTDTYDLGGTTKRWSEGFFATGISIGDDGTDAIRLLEIGASLLVEFAVASGEALYPSDNSTSSITGHDLGKSTNQWRDIYAFNTVIQAYCEYNLLTEEEKQLGKLTVFEEGMVMVWKNKHLSPCTIPYDPMVQATSTDRGMPNVMGAEPILVLGPISEGDYLVSSSTPGYAMKGELSKLVPGCVIGQALEDFSGEKGKIKAMIRKF